MIISDEICFQDWGGVKFYHRVKTLYVYLLASYTKILFTLGREGGGKMMIRLYYLLLGGQSPISKINIPDDHKKYSL